MCIVASPTRSKASRLTLALVANRLMRQTLNFSCYFREPCPISIKAAMCDYPNGRAQITTAAVDPPLAVELVAVPRTIVTHQPVPPVRAS